MGVVIKMDTRIQPPARIMRKLGVNATGRVQSFLTARVLLRMRRYMPWREGVLANSQTAQYGASTIVVNAPQARYLYHGVKMRDPNGGGPFPLKDEDGNFTGEFRYRKGAHPVPTGEPLQYTHTTNPLAGPFWDRTLVQHEGRLIAREVTEYARRQR